MSTKHGGYTDLAHYRSSIFRFGLPYVVVTALAFTASLLGTEDTDWFTYLLGWTVALSSVALSFIRPQFWILGPFGALGGALLVRASTDGLDAGLGPLLMIPALAVAVYGSRKALYSMIGTIAMVVVLIEIFANEEAALSPAWRQDAILVVLATVLAIAIQDLVTRMRSERSLAAERGQQIEQLNNITKAIATSTNGGAALCEITTEVTEATGAALFHLNPDGALELVAAQNGRNEMLRQIAAGPALIPLAVMESGNRMTVTGSDLELNLHRMAWEDQTIGTIVWEPALLNGSPIGAIALAYGPDWEGDEGSVIPIDMLAAEGTIAIQQHRVTEQLEALATTDPLTGIDNRRGWEREIERAVARAGRQHQPLCVAMLDLDHFKQFNDSNGHQAGDRFLQECTNAWREMMRADDHIARYGGEEFALILPNTDIEYALEMVERLRRAVPRQETCSAGIACWDSDESISELVSRADKALYMAKENGRDLSIGARPRDPRSTGGDLDGQGSSGTGRSRK